LLGEEASAIAAVATAVAEFAVADTFPCWPSSLFTLATSACTCTYHTSSTRGNKVYRRGTSTPARQRDTNQCYLRLPKMEVNVLTDIACTKCQRGDTEAQTGYTLHAPRAGACFLQLSLRPASYGTCLSSRGVNPTF